MVRDQLREHDPEAANDLDEIRESDILVTSGAYDFIEDVMKQCGTPCTAINPNALEEASLRPDQVLFVNCPGDFQPRALRRIETFVRGGGFLAGRCVGTAAQGIEGLTNLFCACFVDAAGGFQQGVDLFENGLAIPETGGSGFLVHCIQ